MLLISLDGLSANEFKYLSTNFGFLEEHSNCDISKLSSNTLNSAHGTWGEILSGSPWWESGCVGYAFPRHSLNDLEIGTESSYQFHSMLTQVPTLVVNVPLLEPQNRLWLSDGTNASSRVNPNKLAIQEPFKSYQARPFTSPSYYFGKTKEGTRLCLEIEKQRLTCAESLALQDNWRLGIVRLTAFDQLAHLLGPHYLRDTSLAVHSAIESFISKAGESLKRIIQSAEPTTIAVVSAYSHVECKKRVNLNQVMTQLGLCKLLDKATVQKEQALRYQSATALSNRIDTSPLISTTNIFVEESCIAASPVQGAVYINKKDRFKNGLIDINEQVSKTNEIASQLKSALCEAGINNINIESPPSKTLAPDLMIYAEGVDFHNLYDAPAVDAFSHPKSCHSTTGFVCMKNNNSTDLSYTSLHSLLEGRLN